MARFEENKDDWNFKMPKAKVISILDEFSQSDNIDTAKNK